MKYYAVDAQMAKKLYETRRKLNAIFYATRL